MNKDFDVSKGRDVDPMFQDSIMKQLIQETARPVQNRVQRSVILFWRLFDSFLKIACPPADLDRI